MSGNRSSLKERIKTKTPAINGSGKNDNLNGQVLRMSIACLAIGAMWFCAPYAEKRIRKWFTK